MAAARAKGIIVLSATVYGEIAEVLARPKFARILTEDRRRETLELLAAAALWIEPTERVEDCRDAKDNRYLELAVAARASVIVSGDGDLLVLNPLARCSDTAARAISRRTRGGQAISVHRNGNGTPPHPSTPKPRSPRP